MKTSYFLSFTFLTFFMLLSCNQKSHDTHLNPQIKQQDTAIIQKDTAGEHNHGVDSQVVDTQYSCPMHPEEIGKKDEKCSKCGMKLTEPVIERKENK